MITGKHLIDGVRVDSEARFNSDPAAVADQTMLTDGIAGAYRAGVARIQGSDSVGQIIGNACTERAAAPFLFTTDGDTWLRDETLGEEVFGPLGIIVRARDFEQVCTIARHLRGQLTCTLHLEPADNALAARLMPLLERKACRILANGFPTGVEVCNATVHGGPYPASTNCGASSVGTLAIRRFLRPVCYQDMPTTLLPDELKNRLTPRGKAGPTHATHTRVPKAKSFNMAMELGRVQPAQTVTPIKRQT